MQEVTRETFNSDVLKHPSECLVYLYDSECPSTTGINRSLSFVEKEGVRVYTSDVTVEGRVPLCAEDVTAHSVPCFLAFSGGKFLRRGYGKLNKKQIMELFEQKSKEDLYPIKED